jgi:hypothetical protein
MYIVQRYSTPAKERKLVEKMPVTLPSVCMYVLLMSDLRLVGVGTGLEVGLFNPPAIPGECPLVLSQLPAVTAPGVRARI